MASMTLLQLFQRAYRESGQSGAAPTSITGLTGRAADVLQWVIDAWEDIANAKPNWTWDWTTGSFALTIGTDSYTPSAAPFSITGGVRAWAREGAYVYPTASGVSARQWLSYMEWDRFRTLPIPPVSGLPQVFSIEPGGNLRYYPVPAVATTAVHEYQQQPQVLALTGDTPRAPGKFHMAVVWKAVMLACNRTRDWSRYDSAEEQYNRNYAGMTAECLPEITMAGPLA